MKYFLPDHSIYFNMPNKKAQHPLPFPFLFHSYLLNLQTTHWSHMKGEMTRGSETLDKLWGQLSGNLKDVSVFHKAGSLFSWLLCDECRAKVFCKSFTPDCTGKVLESRLQHDKYFTMQQTLKVYPARCSYHSSVIQEHLALTFPWKMKVVPLI